MSRRSRFARGCRRIGIGAAALGIVSLCAAPAQAATSTIDFVEIEDDEVTLVVSMDDLGAGESPDLDTVTVTFDGEPVAAEAESASDGAQRIRRTTVLALDTSDSMAVGGRFEEAQAAAQAFLDSVPDDVQVGLVTFDAQVRTLAEPTDDHEGLSETIDDLELARGTLLYDGLIEAVETAGNEGSRSVLLLSDGKNTNDTELEEATSAAKKSLSRSSHPRAGSARPRSRRTSRWR